MVLKAEFKTLSRVIFIPRDLVVSTAMRWIFSFGPYADGFMVQWRCAGFPIAPARIRIDLKFGDFEPAHKGQMELYLRWLDKHERRAGEEAPMGLILCAGKNEECIELLELDRSGIHVAEYLTEFPSKVLLREKLLKAIERARTRLQCQDEGKDGKGND